MTKPLKDAPPETPHPAYPEHKLKLVKPGDDAPFQCNGCMEPGAGARYTSACRPGNLVLHKDCALAEPTLVHPLLKKSMFKLRHKPPAPTSDEARLCDACGGKVLGFYYHCAKTGLDLHPCCAKLPLVVSHGELSFELRTEASHRCSSCRAMDGYYRFWFYRSTCKTVYLHVKCMKEMAGRSRSGAGGSSSTDEDSMVTNFAKEAALPLKRSPGERAGSSKFQSICKMVLAVVRIIIAAIIGDPTPILVAGVSAFISNVL